MSIEPTVWLDPSYKSICFSSQRNQAWILWISHIEEKKTAFHSNGFVIVARIFGNNTWFCWFVKSCLVILALCWLSNVKWSVYCPSASLARHEPNSFFVTKLWLTKAIKRSGCPLWKLLHDSQPANCSFFCQFWIINWWNKKEVQNITRMRSSSARERGGTC